MGHLSWRNHHHVLQYLAAVTAADEVRIELDQSQAALQQCREQAKVTSTFSMPKWTHSTQPMSLALTAPGEPACGGSGSVEGTATGWHDFGDIIVQQTRR